MTGTQTTRWTVIRESGFDKHGFRKILCQCKCGEKRTILKSSFVTGRSMSCGCLQKEIARSRFTKHGEHGSRTYRCWDHMIQRCENRKNTRWVDYGGRGISVCERWHDFRSFLTDMGECPSDHSIDRINNDGNYEPGNCRWANIFQQSQNTRRNVFLELNGERKTISEWSRCSGLAEGVLRYRADKKWPADLILSIPSFTGNRISKRSQR